jgi:hypothetical protein
MALDKTRVGIMRGRHNDAEWCDIPTQCQVLIARLKREFVTFRQLKANSQASLGRMLLENEKLADALAILTSRIRPGIYVCQRRCGVSPSGRYEVEAIVYDMLVTEPEKLIWIYGNFTNRNKYGSHIVKCTLSRFLEEGMLRISDDGENDPHDPNSPYQIDRGLTTDQVLSLL